MFESFDLKDENDREMTHHFSFGNFLGINLVVSYQHEQQRIKP